jgi:hypothetical protein
MLGKVVAKSVEMPLPARASLGDPLLGRLQRRRLNAAGTHASDLLRANKPARFQDLEMLDDRWERHRKRPGELAHRSRSAAQPLDHEPSGRIR